MSTIILPALRRDRHNLFRYSTAGVVSSLTGALGSGTGPVFGVTNGSGGSSLDDVTRIVLANVGLAVGDVISAQGDVAYDASAGQTVRFRLVFADAAGATIGATQDAPTIATPTGFVNQQLPALVIPATCVQIYLVARVSGGTGTAQIRRCMINRGATVQAFEHPKRGATAPMSHVAFGMQGLQSVLQTASGVTQITSFPSRLWGLQFGTIPMLVSDNEAREWELALHRLSDLANVFRYVPPDYAGPRTGYTGPSPLVNGASQLGTSLNCDGVDLSTAIGKSGDYVSVDVASPLGNTNPQLFKLAADATSNGSGQVTFTFTKPIRLAPANDAVVQIFAPTAQFRLAAPQHETSSDSTEFTDFRVDATEQVYP